MIKELDSTEVTVSVAPDIDVVAVSGALSVESLAVAPDKPAHVLLKGSGVLVAVD